MNTAQFPTSTFELAAPINLGNLPTDTTERPFPAWKADAEGHDPGGGL